MGKLAERRAERAAITEWHDEEKRRIHQEYMEALTSLEVKTTSRRRALARVQREAMNKALTLIDAGEA